MQPLEEKIWDHVSGRRRTPAIQLYNLLENGNPSISNTPQKLLGKCVCVVTISSMKSCIRGRNRKWKLLRNPGATSREPVCDFKLYIAVNGKENNTYQIAIGNEKLRQTLCWHSGKPDLLKNTLVR
jgi:hypothetical protein